MRTWAEWHPAHRKFLFFKVPAQYRACLAGHTLLAAGYKLDKCGSFTYGTQIKCTVSTLRIPLIARDLLGLTEEEQDFTYPGHRYDSESCSIFCGGVTEANAIAAFAGLIAAEESRRQLNSIAVPNPLTAEEYRKALTRV